MFTLEYKAAFYLLALIPIMFIVYAWARRRLAQRKELFGNSALVDRLIIGSHQSTWKKWSIMAIAVTCIIFAAVNPQWGLKKEKVKVEKSDIFVALDISTSMNATDISPNRLEKAKRFVELLIKERRGDQIGLILFAGGAYLQMPLTADYAAALLFTKSASTDMAGTQGTAIGEAIDLAQRSISGEDKAQRALIILSDGEDHDQEALDKAEDAVGEGWNIFTVGVGTTSGAYVPVLNNGREEYKMDDEGNPVKSALNPSLLQDIANQGRGSYFTLEGNEMDIIRNLHIQLEKLQKREVEIKSFTEFRSFYQYLLAIGLGLLILEFFMSSKLTKYAG